MLILTRRVGEPIVIAKASLQPSLEPKAIKYVTA
jgi:hypothetical protein